MIWDIATFLVRAGCLAVVIVGLVILFIGITSEIRRDFAGSDNEN